MRIPMQVLALGSVIDFKFSDHKSLQVGFVLSQYPQSEVQQGKNDETSHVVTNDHSQGVTPNVLGRYSGQHEIGIGCQRVDGRCD